MGVVSKACGLLMGCARSFDPQWGWVNVAGVKEETTTVPTLGELLITLDPKALPDWDTNGTGARMLYWHHESGAGRSLSTKAVACNVALVRAIGRLFGGTVTLNDATDEQETYPAPSVDVWAEDGQGWYQLQALLAAIKPLTIEDMDEAVAYAAYQGGAR